ncbi:SDR family NAD(P)-dependent oxidoreductase [Aliikangiella coralliicola]|uniref:SDR family NAD(P)-dependent oxidoreductase n=2 Tax=Aliikangiella coralliicola TaxID=2592383 RepID=A0A545UGS6_9GAMM|nr:SDR family NAD(P)-dependent oxidoreductase [Aliikangiella coralliicola]
MDNEKAKIIIVGATSGIGLALAKKFVKDGHKVGVAGRRLEKLKAFQQKFLGKAFIKQMDITLTGQAIIQLDHLINQMEGVDIIVISAGIGFVNPELDWQKEQQTIDTNVRGFSAVASASLNYFIKQGHGQLVSISSINALRGSDVAPAYAASKAFVSNYMQGLRKKVFKLGLPISVTDIQPGFVATKMAKGDGLFWVSSSKKAASQIKNAILKKRKHVYITKRWRLVAWLLKILPDWLYHRI